MELILVYMLCIFVVCFIFYFIIKTAIRNGILEAGLGKRTSLVPDEGPSLTMTCPECGKTHFSDMRACPHCGHVFDQQ